jgi:hypothetical protein
MRTTLDIRDDILEQVRVYAAARSISNELESELR